MSLKGSSVTDRNGAPIHISAIVNYKIVDAAASIYSVENLKEFIENQSLEVMRSVCSQFSYRSKNPKEPSLMNASSLIGSALKDMVQERCNFAGV